MKPIPGLQDIQGLDHISLWPLATGSWVFIGLVITGLFIYLTHSFLKTRRERKWQTQILRELENLHKNLKPDNSQATAVRLSEILRRLAIHRFSREDCASLKGVDWLQWLSRKDTTKFDWMRQGVALIEAPFCPPGTLFDTQSLQQTISASKAWVKSC